MRMWDLLPPFLTVHRPLSGKQHIKISGWCSVTFIWDIFGQFRRNLGEIAIGLNSDFQLQYKLNEIMTTIILTFDIS